MKKISKGSEIFGVCTGLAEYSKIEVSFIRLAFVIATFMGAGSPILVYILLAFIMEQE